MLGFLQKMTLTPHALTAADAVLLREAGLSREAAYDAVKVAFCFNLIDRLADSFDFAIPKPGVFAKAAPAMIRFGYKM